MKLKTECANGIKVGHRVQWRTYGQPRKWGAVEEIYLSFKYPRGLRFWREPTIKVNTVFVIRDRYGVRHHIPQDRVMKDEGK